MSRRRSEKIGFLEVEYDVEIPKVKRLAKRVKEYDDLLNRFLESEVRTCKIKVTDKDPKVVYTALHHRITDKTHPLPIKIHLIGKEIYLEKTQ